MACGPNHIVAVVNLQVAFYTKTGTKTFQQTMDQNGFWAGVGGNSEIYSDPKVFFDAVSHRWFVFMIEVDGLSNGAAQRSRALVAVSDDDNPNGTWFKYSLDALINVGGNALWMDYPTTGMNKDGIAIAGNMFGFSSGGGVAQVMVVPKAPLLTGASATVSSFQPSGFTIQPARSWDPAATNLYCVAQGGGSSLNVYSVSNITATPVMVQTTVTVPSYQGPTPAPSAGGNQLDTLGGRLFNCWYRAGKMVTAHCVTTAQNGNDHVRWYEVAVNTWPTSGQPTLVQSGEIIPSGSVATHMPAICQNAANDISVIYTRSSATIAADLCISSRFSSDPIGAMGSPVLLQGSSGTYGAFRWGDFFSCVVDPTDELTFWGYGMTITSQGVWETSIHSWQVSTGGVGTPVDADSITTNVGTFLAGDASSITSANNVTYQIASAGIPQFGQAGGAAATFTVPTDARAITIKLASNAGIGGGTNMVWLRNWSTNQYVLIGSVPMPASGNAIRSITVRSTDVSKYISVTGEVDLAVRGHLPIRPFNNSMPNPFLYQIDMLQLLIR